MVRVTELALERVRIAGSDAVRSLTHLEAFDLGESVQVHNRDVIAVGVCDEDLLTVRAKREAMCPFAQGEALHDLITGGVDNSDLPRLLIAGNHVFTVGRDAELGG